MTIMVYGIPNCDQVKKARAWLDRHDRATQFHDFKKAGIDAARIAAWQQAVGWEALLNRKGTTWRGLSEERRVAVTDAASACAAMIEFPSLIKRPVLEIDGQIAVGFSESQYQSLFNSFSGHLA